MEEITKILSRIEKEIAEQKNEIKNLKTMEVNITNKINTNINEKFSLLETKNVELEEKINNQEKEIEFLERKVRKKNIIVFGVDEQERNYQELLNKIIEIFVICQVYCSGEEIEQTYRIGRKGEKIRPIIVTFTTFGKKLEILKNKKLLENTNYYIKEDYSKRTIEERKKLQQKLEEEKRKGKKAIIKHNKIIILEEKIGNLRNSKRTMIESPEKASTNNEISTNRQENKKNKTSLQDYVTKMPRGNILIE